MASRTPSINRALVLPLWAAVVAQRLDFDAGEALTLGKFVAGLNAQAEGQRIGLVKLHEERAKRAREEERDEQFGIEVLGRSSVFGKTAAFSADYPQTSATCHNGSPYQQSFLRLPGKGGKGNLYSCSDILAEARMARRTR